MATPNLPGWNDTDRDLAPNSPYHSTGQRKEVQVTLIVTINAPAEMSDEDIRDQIEWGCSVSLIFAL